MKRYRYRAALVDGGVRAGSIDAPDRSQALAQLRRRGEVPLELDETTGTTVSRTGRVGGAARAAAIKLVGELGVLLDAGMPLDRALALAVDNVEFPVVRARVEPLVALIREGMPLSSALPRAEGLYPPMAQAMIEAGEANGRLGDALARLATTLQRAEGLRQLIVSASIYPAALLVIAGGVVLLMLLFVVPTFETVLTGSSAASLPVATRAVIGASRALRGYGLYAALAVLLLLVLLRGGLRRPALRTWRDRVVLRLPQIGRIVAYGQTAQFARILAVLIEGGVDLPQALGTAQRSLSNSVFAAATARIAAELREGGGLTAPLAASGVFPRIAIGFFRTGEETSRLAPMLERLADVLEADVRVRLQRLIAILTPAITVILGGIVASIIAAIMTAILGFNDLAVS